MTASSYRIVPLEDMVRQFPGKIAVSYLRGSMSKKKRYLASVYMVEIISQPYGWFRLMLLGLSHTLTLGWFYPNSCDDYESPWPPVCSEAYAKAMRKAGYDPCPKLADSHTEPSDLFESKRFEPMYVLV
jgi:hypothetical protein